MIGNGNQVNLGRNLLRKSREITSSELTTDRRVTLGTLTSKGPISRLRLSMLLKAIAMIEQHQLYQHKVLQLLP
jgi:hypothetical protein